RHARAGGFCDISPNRARRVCPAPRRVARIDPAAPRMVAYPPMLRHPQVGRPKEGVFTLLTTPTFAAQTLRRRLLPALRSVRPPAPSVRTVTAGLLALGVLFRLRAYLHGRALWLDEVYLALNLVPRSYAELLQPLDHDQGAPLGFLLAAKFLIRCFGESEFVLRLLPFACGLLSLFLFQRIARQLLRPAAACFALAV